MKGSLLYSDSDGNEKRKETEGKEAQECLGTWRKDTCRQMRLPCQAYE